jgi:hypothetical protein
MELSRRAITISTPPAIEVDDLTKSVAINLLCTLPGPPPAPPA